MEIRAENDHTASLELARAYENIRQNPLPPVFTVEENSTIKLPILLEEKNELSWIKWSISEERGEKHEGETNLSTVQKSPTEPLEKLGIKRYLIPIQANLKLGYHNLSVRLSTGKLFNTFLIVTPQRAYHRISRCWGITVQLYSIKSKNNFGIGDLGDLNQLLNWTSKIGGRFVGLNPLYCLHTDDPHHISPYSPSTRRFLNPWYIDIQSIPEFMDSGTNNCKQLEIVNSLQKSPTVEYEKAVPLKNELLKNVFERFLKIHASKNTPRWQSFQKFIQKKGNTLNLFAKFETLRQHFQTPWFNWPNEAREKKDLEKYTTEKETLYRKFLQFIAEEQLQSVIASGKRTTPSVTLFLDFPVSADAGGFDTWYEPELYSLSAELGAPPDDFNPTGQKWGIVPFIPHKLVEKKFQPFIEMLRTAMKFAGIIRLDHIIGLMRLFWIPKGDKPNQGVYVQYPFKDLLGIVTLESVRNKCVVVGEDLGTVPETVRSKMEDKRIFTYKVLYFEKDTNGQFKKPDEYPLYALSTESTHDLPTLAGFWKGTDLSIRRKLNLISEEMYRKLKEQREEDKKKLIEVLISEGLLKSGEFSIQEIIEALLIFVAKTNSTLTAIQMEDLLATDTQPNLPGTTSEYPSWKIRLEKTLEEIQNCEKVSKLATTITKTRSTVKHL